MAFINEWRKISINKGHDGEASHYGNNRIVSSRYTWLTFIPKVFFEHFRRLSNIFFLALIILQLSLSVPTNPSAYIVAFTVVLSVSTIRQAYEDLIRHKADDKINKKKVMRFDYKNSIFTRCAAADLIVGNIVKLDEDDNIPADMLLLGCVTHAETVSSKTEVTTGNLDGETNRKFRFSPVISEAQTTFDESAFVNTITTQVLELEYEQPNVDLYQFNGLIRTGKIVHANLSAENILLRGTTAKNCKNVYGCVIYTGFETRLSMNSVKAKRNKFSIVDQTTNKIVFIVFGALLVLTSLSLGLFFYTRNTSSFTLDILFGRKTLFEAAWYIPEEDETDLWLAIITFFLFLVFLSYMIPISLSISVEIQKVWCSIFFGWDEDMKCTKTGEAAICNTSDLNEELGQIEYLLTDKTGTLTENELEFMCCSVAGQKYNYFENPAPNLLKAESPQADVKLTTSIEKEYVEEFVEAIALCHTVRVIETPLVPTHYQGSSADEEVLVEFAKNMGVVYLGENVEGVHVLQYANNQRKFKRHHLLHFDSDRKCMSVIAEDENEKIFIISKGAEFVLLPKCQLKSDPTVFAKVSNHVDEFAGKGYRTLVVAKKELSREEFISIGRKLQKLHHDPLKLQQFYSEIESDLTLLGATGVVDKLQTNVNQTLGLLKSAGIRIWMLTGDKQETAVSTAVVAGLIPDNSFQSFDDSRHYVINITDSDLLFQHLTKIKQNSDAVTQNSTLVIDGTSFALGFEHCRALLANVTINSTQVILCRMTPLQKAQVVRLIKETSCKRICAVGDGGNDVAMIQEAHIGIGIFGREGRQAARAADFAIPQFQHLAKAILVHGNWFYYRLTTLVNYFFYRGFLFVLPQLLYGFDSGFSGQTVYDASFMMCYSLLFAAVPIVLYGIYEQHDSMEGLLQNPKAYQTYRRNTLMRGWSLLKWASITLWHTFLVFYFPRIVLSRDSEEMDWAVFSHMLNNLVVAVTVIKVASITVYFHVMVLAAQIFSLSSVIVFYAISSEIVGIGSLGYAYFPLLINPQFWFVAILVTVMSAVPDLIEGGLRRLQYLKRKHQQHTINQIILTAHI